MKLFRARVCSVTALAAAAFASVNPQLHGVKRVYILAMSSGMDQYLASHLTKAAVFEVVTDPKRADAIVTDNVGESFQKKLDDLYSSPAPVKTEPEATKPAADSAPPPDVGDRNAPDQKGTNRLAGVDFGGGAHVNSLSRGRGNFFVVDRSSRIVLWSVYEHPKNSTPGELTKTAARVVKHLKDDLTDKKPAE
jgi:hypothetical protein